MDINISNLRTIWDIGDCDMITHRVDLVENIPLKQKHRIPPSMIEEVRNHIEMFVCLI